MRASLRCKKHSQGDKCRLENGHSGDHQGVFATWNGKERTELYKRRSAPRNRVHNRMIRSASNTAPQVAANMRAEERSWALKQLNKAMQYLRGHGS